MSDVSKENEDSIESSSNKLDNADRSLSKSYFIVLREEILNFVNEPRFAKFAFQFFIIATGAVLLKVLADRGFPLQDTLQFMFAWFLLMLLVPTPKAAKTDVDPFGEEEIDYIDGSQQLTKVKSKVMGSEDLQQCPKCEKFQPLQSIQCEYCEAELV